MMEENDILEEEKTVEEDYKTKYLYAMADILNIKRQYSEKIQNARINGEIDFAKCILPSLDNFKKAIENNDASDGVKMAYDVLVKSLTDIGLEKIDTENKKFDVNLHEAVSEFDGGKERGEIIECFQDGYTYKGNVIRYAKVVVNS